ncbi:MAG: ABC transporter permease [Lachnospiraceae bacterium]|nr:ABC transporter permease [Lachnospiraceae bacterium]
MSAIYFRELKSYFTGMIGPVVVAALMVFIGFHFWIYNLGSGYPYFARALTGVASYLIIIVPILTMKSMSEDKKAKTDQVLLTSAVNTTQIVLGKYFATLTVFAIPVLYSCIFPIILGFKTYHSYLIDYTTILAFFLMGAAYIAIGLFISSLTESQIIAAITCFLTIFLMMLIPMFSSYISDSTLVNAVLFSILAFILVLIVNSTIRNAYASTCIFIVSMIVIWGLYFIKGDVFAGAFSKMLNIVTFSNGISYYAAGVFDLKGIVMFLSVSILFVFLTVQSVQKRRWI